MCIYTCVIFYVLIFDIDTLRRFLLGDLKKENFVYFLNKYHEVKRKEHQRNINITIPPYGKVIDQDIFSITYSFFLCHHINPLHETFASAHRSQRAQRWRRRYTLAVAIPWSLCRKRPISRAMITSTDTQVTDNAAPSSTDCDAFAPQTKSPSLVTVSLSTLSVPSRCPYTFPNPSTSGVTPIAPAYSRRWIKGNRIEYRWRPRVAKCQCVLFRKINEIDSVLTNRWYPIDHCL